MFNNWFISPHYRRHSRLVLFTVVLAFVVIVLGAYTRLTDAGLSCPDWPHCYGYLTAPYTDFQLKNAALAYPLTPVNIKKAWTEMTHRYFAGIEGVLILILAGSILFNRKTKDSKAYLIALALIFLLMTQVALGMLTVTAKLKPIIVLAHLLNGLSLLCILWWAYLDLYLHDLHATIPIHLSVRRFLPWLMLGLVIILAQIALGGWVSTHYAGLACVDFPYCNGKLLPTLQWNHFDKDLITIHMLHRLGATITTIYFTFLSLFLFFTPALKRIAMVLFALLSLQIILGILNIIWLRPLWIALIHQSVAILLLLTVITALVKVSLARENRYVSRIS